jgi:dUTPase
MQIYVKKVAGLVLPTQANPKDAAYDIVATTPPMIVGDKVERPMDGMPMWKRVAYIEYGTNLYIAPVAEKATWKDIGIDYHTQLFPRSSISRYNLVLANSVGTVDNGYRNQIMCRFKYIFQPEDYLVVPEMGITKIYGLVNPDHLYNAGEKIVQIKACANVHIEFIEVDNLEESQRGLGGFGSSGA